MVFKGITNAVALFMKRQLELNPKNIFLNQQFIKNSKDGMI